MLTTEESLAILQEQIVTLENHLSFSRDLEIRVSKIEKQLSALEYRISNLEFKITSLKK